MQLDLLQDDDIVKQEHSAPEKKVKRPQKHYETPQELRKTPEQTLPKLPQSLVPPFAVDAIAKEEIEKDPAAFKTISEAAKLLDVPQHVLRFWESRFSQIKPLKMNGGRRYYRPQDIDILSTIKHLLYKQGYTIKGAKKAFSTEKQMIAALKVEQQPVVVAAPSDTSKFQLKALRQELMDFRDHIKMCIAE